MSNNANTKLTNEQAFNILAELASLDSLKLNLKEHGAVQAALGVIKELVDAAKAQSAKSPELTTIPENPTV